MRPCVLFLLVLTSSCCRGPVAIDDGGHGASPASTVDATAAQTAETVPHASSPSDGAIRGDASSSTTTGLLVGRHPLLVGEIAWSPTEDVIATCEVDTRWGPGQVTLWNARTLERDGQMGNLDDNDPTAGSTGWDTCSIDFSPDGETLVEARHKHGHVRLWDMKTRSERPGLMLSGVMSVAYSPDGRSIAAVEYADMRMGLPGVTQVKLIDAKSGRTRRTLHLTQYLTAAWFSPDGQRVLVSGGENMIFDARNGRVIAKRARFTEDWIPPVHRRGEYDQEFENSRFKSQEYTVGARSPDGKRTAFLVWTDERSPIGFRIHVTDADSNATLQWLRVPLVGSSSSRQYALAFDTSGAILALVVSGGSDTVPSGLESEIRLWNVETGEQLGPKNLPPYVERPPNDGSSSTHDAGLPPLAPQDEGFVDDRNGRGWGDRCFGHLKAGRHDAARAACLRGLEVTKDKQIRGALLYNLGRVAEARGDQREARRLFEQSLEARPGNERVLERLRKLERLE